MKVGDRVWLSGSVSGTYAQYTLCNSEHVHPLTGTASFDDGGSAWVAYGTAYTALHHNANLREIMARKEGKATLLVHGASGGVGSALVQVASLVHGLFVFGTASSDAGRELVLSNGAKHALDHSKDGYMDELVKLNGGQGPDIVIEMAAHVNLGRDIKYVAGRGRIVVIGSRGDVTVTPRELTAKRAEVVGASQFTMTAAEQKETIEKITEGLGNGSFKMPVKKAYPLAQAPQAHADIVSASGASGKLVLRPWE